MRKTMAHILVSDPNNRLPSKEARQEAIEVIKKLFPLPLMVQKNSGSIFHYKGFHLWFHASKDAPADSFKGFSFTV